MPHARCSVCNHPDVAAIDAAHKAGASVRALAKRFGITSASADRHFHHDEHEKSRKNMGAVYAIRNTQAGIRPLSPACRELLSVRFRV